MSCKGRGIPVPTGYLVLSTSVGTELYTTASSMQYAAPATAGKKKERKKGLAGWEERSGQNQDLCSSDCVLTKTALGRNTGANITIFGTSGQSWSGGRGPMK